MTGTRRWAKEVLKRPTSVAQHVAQQLLPYRSREALGAVDDGGDHRRVTLHGEHVLEPAACEDRSPSGWRTSPSALSPSPMRTGFRRGHDLGDMAGACKAASTTTRHPMLWPTNAAGGRASACMTSATSAPYRSMEHSATVPGLVPCPRRSTATVWWRGERWVTCTVQSLCAQPKP